MHRQIFGRSERLPGDDKTRCELFTKQILSHRASTTAAVRNARGVAGPVGITGIAVELRAVEQHTADTKILLAVLSTAVCSAMVALSTTAAAAMDVLTLLLLRTLILQLRIRNCWLTDVHCTECTAVRSSTGCLPQPG